MQELFPRRSLWVGLVLAYPAGRVTHGVPRICGHCKCKVCLASGEAGPPQWGRPPRPHIPRTYGPPTLSRRSSHRARKDFKTDS